MTCVSESASKRCRRSRILTEMHASTGLPDIVAKGRMELSARSKLRRPPASHTPGTFTLAQLADSVTSVKNLEVSTEPGKAMLTTTDIELQLLGRKRLYLASSRWAGDFISSYELDGAQLTTQLLSMCQD